MTTIIAEVGINHNGDVRLAHDAIDQIAEAGADGVKFQNYRTEDFVLDPELTITYQSRGVEVTEPQFDLFKRCELTIDELGSLVKHANDTGLIFQSTPTSEQGVDDLYELGCYHFKNGSDYLGHLQLLKKMCTVAQQTSGLVVVSCGMATLQEIADAVDVFHMNKDHLILLHCVSAYPALYEEMNLRAMETLHRTFGIRVGLSDHTGGNTVAITAVALGASWIEKHFTPDKELSGPDHWFSTDEDSLRDLVDDIRIVEQAMGHSSIRPRKSEKERRLRHRLSCVASIDIREGNRILRGDLQFARSQTGGLPPKDVMILVNRYAARPIKKGEAVKWEDVLT